MKKQQLAIPVLRKFFTGSLPDVIQEIPNPLKPQHLVVGVVSEDTRPFLHSCMQEIHRFVSMTLDTLEGGRKSTQEETSFHDMGAHFFANVSQGVTVSILRGFLWEAIHRDVPSLENYIGESELCKGWKVCVNKNQNLIPPDEDLFPHNHISRRFFKVLSGIIQDKLFYDGDPYLPKLRPNDQVIGEIDDSMFRQMIMLRQKLTNAGVALQLSSDPLQRELLVNNMKVGDYLRLQRKKERLVKQNTIVSDLLAERLSQYFLGKKLESTVFEPEGPFFATEIRENWKVVIPG